MDDEARDQLRRLRAQGEAAEKGPITDYKASARSQAREEAREPSRPAVKERERPAERSEPTEKKGINGWMQSKKAGMDNFIAQKKLEAQAKHNAKLDKMEKENEKLGREVKIRETNNRLRARAQKAGGGSLLGSISSNITMGAGSPLAAGPSGGGPLATDFGGGVAGLGFGTGVGGLDVSMPGEKKRPAQKKHPSKGKGGSSGSVHIHIHK